MAEVFVVKEKLVQCTIQSNWAMNSWGFRRALRFLLACATFVASGLAAAETPNPATVLRTIHATLGERFAGSPFQRPLHLDSTESANDLKGDAYARLDHPFSTVSAALQRAENWCDVMILHINTKYCRASADPTGTVLDMSIGRKNEQSLPDAYPMGFAYRVAAATPGYLEVRLEAEAGPLGTSDYRILLRAIPIDDSRTFLHFSYGYSYGAVGRMAMRGYLATVGRNKRGFTVVGRQSDGQPEYIAGVRGVVERNTLRYFLAIDAYLGALGVAPPDQFERRLQTWFRATEQYPQLHEVDRNAYLEMKRRENLRQKERR